MPTPIKFYYQIDGSVIGPVSGVLLREAAFTGNVVPNTLVSNSPTGSWAPAARVRGLFDGNGNPLPHPPETERELKHSQDTPPSNATAGANAHIDELLDQWEEGQEEGKTISIEELCRNCPELVDELRQRIREIEWVDDVMATQTPSDSAEVEAFEIPRTLGRYRLEKLLGQGGFGQVWKAFDPKLERNVAIKVLRPERSRTILQVDRFLSEARKLARLKHNNIVSVHETDHDGKWYFMVTDWINGTDLAALLRTGRQTPDESVRIVAKIADALQHAHEHGVIHRDVKPHNILLDKDGEPYITDFGIAVTESELLNDDSDTSGTPAYMAPEQASFVGPAVDPRTDVYSLGVVLYELLVGKVPHTTTTLAMLRASFKSKKVKRPSKKNADVSSKLSKVCLKAMAIDPNDRWQSAEEFARRLRTSMSTPTSDQSPSQHSPNTAVDERNGSSQKSYAVVLWSLALLVIVVFFGKSIANFSMSVIERGKVFVGQVDPLVDSWLRPVPLQVTFRESDDRQGMVVIIRNTSELPLYNIRVMPSDDVLSEFLWQLAARKWNMDVAKVLGPGETIEVGESLGERISSGGYIGVGCDDYENVVQEAIP